jgi:hypothetical protein
MCKQAVTYDVRAEDLSPGEAAVILGKVRIVARVAALPTHVLIEDSDGARHYMSPERAVTVHSEGER